MGNFWESDPQKRWERDTRQWWGWLASGIVAAVSLAFFVWKYTLIDFAAFGFVLAAVFGFAAVLGSFQAGFFYNDRLRQLGKTQGFLPKLRRPPSENNVDKAVSGGPQAN